jgi:hypothetical protein
MKKQLLAVATMITFGFMNAQAPLVNGGTQFNAGFGL